VFARQRYWGEPIPVLKDGDTGGARAHGDELPLRAARGGRLPPAGTGESPLANATEGLDSCGRPGDGPHALARDRHDAGQRGVELVLPAVLRPAQHQAAFCAREKSDYWMPVDLYVGGAEHRVGHLLYARMWQRFLHEGLVRDAEPFAKLRHQGMVLGETFYATDAHGSERIVHPDVVVARGDKTATVRLGDETREVAVRFEKMSKRKGNVVNPDDVIREYGADALRVYLCFLTPLESDKPWQSEQLAAQRKWLERVWRLFFDADDNARVLEAEPTEEALRVVHKAVAKVTEDIEALSLNTAVSALHVATRDLAQQGAYHRALLEPLARLLAPFAPHLAEELWTRGLGHRATPGGLAYEPWPVADPRYTVDDTVVIGVQVNGKTAGTVSLAVDAPEANAVEAARAVVGVARHLDGKTIVKVIYKAGKILNLIAR
jgi:leucyl-tRNA synthetase